MLCHQSYYDGYHHFSIQYHAHTRHMLLSIIWDRNYLFFIMIDFRLLTVGDRSTVSWESSVVHFRSLYNLIF